MIGVFLMPDNGRVAVLRAKNGFPLAEPRWKDETATAMKLGYKIFRRECSLPRMALLVSLIVTLLGIFGCEKPEKTSPPVRKDQMDHGVVAPVGMSTWKPSIIATVDAQGRRSIFTKLWTGNKASYLFIDAETGKTEQVYPEDSGLGAYGVLMTPENVIYDTMGNHLLAIDVPTRKVRPVGSFDGGFSLGGYVRAEDGTVYAGLYPNATLVSWNPTSKTFINHGALNDEAWPQYLRPLVMDSSGWLYGSIGLQEGQVVGFHPPTGTKVVLIPKDKRRRGQPELFRGEDGQVYANAAGWGWHRLSEGIAMPTEHTPPPEARADGRTFPDGSRITEVNIPDRKLCITDVGEWEPRELRFDYHSAGVAIYTIVAGPDGKIYGSTGIPLRIWSFDPAIGKMWNSGLGGYDGHINQLVRQGDKLYGAVYSGGQLLEYDPHQPFDDADMAVSKNPRQVHRDPAAIDLYGRPNAVLAHSDGRHILVGGKAARVVRGSGMLIYDTETGEEVMLDRKELLPDHGINAMISLPDGDVLVGTSIHPPTGGSAGTDTTAMLYRFNMATRTIRERWPLQPATPAVYDMVVAADGLVYGLAEPSRFFVFNPASGEFVHQEELSGYGDAAGYMAPRCMSIAPDGNIYAIFQKAVVRIEPGTFRHRAIFNTADKITAGIAIQDGRLYFACGSRLFSCALNPSAAPQ